MCCVPRIEHKKIVLFCLVSSMQETCATPRRETAPEDTNFVWVNTPISLSLSLSLRGGIHRREIHRRNTCAQTQTLFPLQLTLVDLWKNLFLGTLTCHCVASTLLSSAGMMHALNPEWLIPSESRRRPFLSLYYTVTAWAMSLPLRVNLSHA
jgi:hypothetical protein